VEKKTDITGIIAVIALVVFLAVVVLLAAAWLFTLGWSAFMVPVFGLPSIDIAQAVSLFFMVWLVGRIFSGLRPNSKKPLASVNYKSINVGGKNAVR